MNKEVSIDKAIDLIEDGMTIMVGGFLGCGNPHRLIDKLVEKGTKNLTLICNDSSFPDFGVGKLIVNKQIKKHLRFCKTFVSKNDHASTIHNDKHQNVDQQ